MADLGRLFKDAEPYIIEMRRWFHQHPEVSLHEEQTSKRIKEELDKMGIPHEDLPPTYGVVATIKGGKGGDKVIGARADIDALPVTEQTGLPFASCNEGVMHACGHDAHAAMLLGVAKVLNEVRDELAGTVKLFFQIGEENGNGWKEIVEYVDNNGGIDRVIGLHIWSTLPAGEILLLPGPIFAGGLGWKADVIGQGGHGARPDLVKDPIKAACDFALQISSIPSNYYDVLDHSVVNVGQIVSGTMGNVFPSEAHLAGGARYYKNGGAEVIADHIYRMAEGVGKIHGVEIKVDINLDKGVKPVYNDPELIPHAKELVKDVDGLELSPQTDPICAGDDFCYILERYSGFYGVLGAGAPDAYPQHHAKFDVKESEFRKGAEFMGRYIADYLS